MGVKAFGIPKVLGSRVRNHDWLDGRWCSDGGADVVEMVVRMSLTMTARMTGGAVAVVVRDEDMIRWGWLGRVRSGFRRERRFLKKMMNWKNHFILWFVIYFTFK